MSPPELVCAQHGAVRVLRLNRPERLNALTPAVFDALRLALIEAEQDEGTRAVVLTGTGRAFCAGGDLDDVAAALDRADPATSAYARTLQAQSVLSQIEWSGTPVIAMVNGLAYAGGLALVLSCDLVVASDQAVFCAPEARLSLVDPYMPARLAPRIGVERARFMMLTSAKVGAEEALAWGLVSRVAPHADLEATTMAIAAEVTANAPSSVRSYKHMLRRTMPEYDLGTYTQATLETAPADGIRAWVQRS